MNGPIDVVESQQPSFVPTSQPGSVGPEPETRSESTWSALLSNSSLYLFLSRVARY